MATNTIKKKKKEKRFTVSGKVPQSLFEKMNLVIEKTERNKNFIVNKALESYCNELLSKVA